MSFSPSDNVLRQVTLRTRDADRLDRFQRDALGLPAGLVQLVEDPHAPLAPASAPGLFHAAFVYPTVEAWVAAVRRTMAAGVEFHGASDHAVSWAAYFADPDGNGLELAWDTPREEWPWLGDRIQMVTRPLPLRSLLANTPEPTAEAEAPRLGHLHLQVADLAQAEEYCAQLGLRVTQGDLRGARFLARGAYHHHLAVNTWRTDPRASRPENAVGLVGWEMASADGRESVWVDGMGNRVALER